MAKIDYITIQRWNSRVCPPLGLAFNFALVWMILAKTPKEMRVQSRILLQTCAVDILLLAVHTIGQLALIFQGQTMVCFFDGYFAAMVTRWFGSDAPQFLFDFYVLLFFLSHFDIFSISTQFMYRYLVLNRNVRMNFRLYALLLLAPFLASLALALTHYWLLMSMEHRLDGEFTLAEQQLIDRYINLDTMGSHFIYSPAKQPNNSVPIVWLSVFTLVNTISYTIIIGCAWKNIRYVGQHTTTISANLREMNKQLTRNLIILASFPLLIHVFVTIFACVAYIQFIGQMTSGEWKVEDGEVDFVLTPTFMFYSIIIYWLPVLNPLISFVVFRPYRNVLCRWKVAPAPIVPPHQ